MKGPFTSETGFFMCMKERSRHKVPAFTLGEVMVTMVVSSLVILLGYSVFTMVSGYFSKSTAQNDLYAERLLVRTILSNDINQCDSMRLRDARLQVFQMRDTIFWETRGDTLTREKSNDLKKFIVGSHSLRLREEEHSYIQVKILFPNGEEDSLDYSFVRPFDLADLINDTVWPSL